MNDGLGDLGLKDEDPRVNPDSGAIAAGHPRRIKGQDALCTMCIGVGQGIAVILERV